MDASGESNRQRQAYLDKVHARVDRWSAEISRLEAAARESTANAKLEYLRQVDGLRQKRDEVLEKLAEIRSASTEAWEELKDGVERVWQDIDNTIESTKSALRGNK
jgi:uncharacterized coiled-coil DUF342 family protein